MNRKLNISKNEVCPRCDYNDKIETFQGESKYKKNVQNWFRNNTTHIENHIQEATHWCERCSIIFKVQDLEN